MDRVVVHQVSKKFKIGSTKKASALTQFISLFSGKEPKKTIKVLEEISFSVAAGEILGVIGKNGSGKSTLLRIIAGIYHTTEGSIETHGKIVSLVNLHLAMYPQLTMRDNIYFLASVFGLTDREISGRFNHIATFSGLEEFIHTKIYQFSEGMKQRLVFSIAIHCDPQILLLDEIFEVGDKEFRFKSAEKIKGLVRDGATVLLVSHSLDLVGKYCDRVIWMDGGRIRAQGPAHKIIAEYDPLAGN